MRCVPKLATGDRERNISRRARDRRSVSYYYYYYYYVVVDDDDDDDDYYY